MKRIISLVLVIVLCLGLCVPAMAATTEKVDITYRAIKIVLNGTEITPCDAAGKTVEPFIMNSNGTTYLPLRAIGQALGLDVKWTPATNTVELTSGGAVKTGDDPAGTTTGTKKVDITYRDIKVVLDGTELELKNALGESVEPFILNSNSSVYLPLRVVGEAFGLTVKWEASTSTVYLDKPAAETEPLTITKQPVDAECSAGESVYFVVEVSGGTAPYTYQWMYKDDTCEWEKCNANIYASGVATATLTVTPDDSYMTYNSANHSKYCCVITDAEGNKVESDVVSVIEKLEPLTITKQPVDAECSAGESVYFVVEVSGGTAPYTYQWMYKDDTCEWEKCNANGYTSGVATATLTVTPDDSYMTYHSANHIKYCCVITDAEGNKVESNAVSVIEKLEPLTITKQPVDVICSVGDTASFSVEVSGGRAPYSYQWQARGVGEFKNLRNGSGATLELTTTEDIFNVRSRSFISEVQCVITDADGNTVTSKAVKLVKAKAPALTVTTQPEDVYTSKNGSSAFTAVYTVAVSGGTAPYTYQWQYGKTSGNGWTDFSGTENWANPGTIKSATLMIGSSQGGMLTAGYIFRCVITDANGEKVYSDAASLNKSITITSHPIDVTCTVPEGDKLNRGFVVIAEGGAEPYTYQWQYRQGDGAWKDASNLSWANSYDTAGMVITIYNGTFDWDYSFRCIITDANGISVTSDAAYLYEGTEQNTSPLTVTTSPMAVYAYVGDKATITAYVAGGTPDYTYEWQFKTSTVSSWTKILNGTNTTGQGTDTLSFTVTSGHLTSNTVFRCVIKDADGATVTTADIKLTAGEK